MRLKMGHFCFFSFSTKNEIKTGEAVSPIPTMGGGRYCPPHYIWYPQFFVPSTVPAMGLDERTFVDILQKAKREMNFF